MAASDTTRVADISRLPDAVRRFCAAAAADDLDGVIATLAADAELVSPLSGRLVFRGREDLRILLGAVYSTLDGLRWEDPIAQGQAAYRKLNQLALALLADGGTLVSCSCSYHLASEDLRHAIQAAARHEGRFVQILESGGQSPDHPVHPAIPETRYLKAFFCRVTRAVG